MLANLSVATEVQWSKPLACHCLAAKSPQESWARAELLQLMLWQGLHYVLFNTKIARLASRTE